MRDEKDTISRVAKSCSQGCLQEAKGTLVRAFMYITLKQVAEPRPSISPYPVADLPAASPDPLNPSPASLFRPLADAPRHYIESVCWPRLSPSLSPLAHLQPHSPARPRRPSLPRLRRRPNSPSHSLVRPVFDCRVGTPTPTRFAHSFHPPAAPRSRPYHSHTRPTLHCFDPPGRSPTSAVRERCPFRGPPLHPHDKVDSTQPAAASSGALQNLTWYLNGTLANLSSVISESSEYIAGTLGVPPALIYSSLAALIAVPITMSRYGWSLRRDHSSPYHSLSGGVPAVTDNDFSYITSQELDDHPIGSSTNRHYHSPSQSAAPPAPEDDVLLFKNRDITYPSHFPAYSIGDGKLRVGDVRKRAGLIMELSDRATRRLKLLYKGRELKDLDAPVRDYGVKNKSEVLAVLPGLGDDSSPSDEEMVIVDDPSKDDKSRRRRKRKPKRRPDRGEADIETSPRDSSSYSKSPTPSVPGSGPLKQINDLATEFTVKWLPPCVQYTAAPPSDPKVREEEHRKLSEMLMQNILLKLDGVETEGIPEVRAKRKELVRSVQDVLKGLDGANKLA